jgi:hypothetical protein
MMRVPATQDEGLALALPGTAQVAVCDAAGIAVSAANIVTVRMQTTFFMVRFPSVDAFIFGFNGAASSAIPPLSRQSYRISAVALITGFRLSLAAQTRLARPE